MRTALITVSEPGAALVRRLKRRWRGAEVFLHTGVRARMAGARFRSILTLTREIFGRYDGLVYVAPCGVVVRAVGPRVRDKRTDPAVVVVDAGGCFAISLLSGHEGGANALAVEVSNILGSEPVITTTTEAVKTVVAGVGCRRGVPAAAVLRALRAALDRAGVDAGEVRELATADIKGNERGVIEAAAVLGLPLRLIASEAIRACPLRFRRSALVQAAVGLPAVAEPAALLAGRRATLLLPRMAVAGVTVALARDGSMWSGSAPARRSTGPTGPKGPSRRAAWSSAIPATSRPSRI